MLTEPTGAPPAVEGLANLRDLGGLPLATGGVTRSGRLLRSDSPHELTSAGVAALVALGVSTVVDLRTVRERADFPNGLAEAGVRCVHAPIFTDTDEFPPGMVTAADVYGWWLRDLRPAIAGALVAIADASAPGVLVHCHAGKDRTGVVVALVLRLAGVTVDAIADDYARSGVQLSEMLARDRVRATAKGMDEVRAERLFTVRREAMAQTIERVDAEHGGATRLLQDAGLDDRRIDRLRRLLVAPSWP